MQNSPTGANTNRKLGIAALQIRDLSTPMHRLAEGCRPYNPAIRNRKENMSNKTKRTHSIQVRLSDEEYEAFNRKFNASGMKSRSDFFRHMIFTGYIVIFNDEKMNELLKLARSISNNFNQVAVRANSGGKVYPEDISALREEVEKLWQPLRFFQSQLMSLHH